MKLECNHVFSEGNNTDKYITIEEKMKPLLVSMKCLGMYFDPQPDSNASGQSQKGQRISTRILGFIRQRLYCYMILLLLWVSCVLRAVGIFPQNDTLPTRVIFMSWNLQCTLNVTIMVFSCQRLSHLRSFYKHWDSLFTSNVTNQIGCGFKCPVKYLMFVTFGGWVVFFINIAAVFTISLGNLSGSKFFVRDIVRPFPKEQWALALQLILHVINTGAWTFPVIFLVVVSRVIKDQFLIIGKVLSKQIQEADGHIPDRLPELRSRYTLLCQAVDIINGTFKWILGISFFLQVFMACFISYNMINGPEGIFTTFVNSFWLGGCFLIIVLLARSSSGVHESAHSLLEDIFHIGTKNATTELLGQTEGTSNGFNIINFFVITNELNVDTICRKADYPPEINLIIFIAGLPFLSMFAVSFQLNLFVSKLSGTSIGFTAINFFVITNEFVLTLGGLFTTYFFLLLQFKI